MQVSTPSRKNVPKVASLTRLSLRGSRVHARMPLRIAPTSFSPSTGPRLGAAGRHQKLHRCALDGLLDPPSERKGTTRILRPTKVHDPLVLYQVQPPSAKDGLPPSGPKLPPPA